MNYLLIFLGGGLGSVSRFGISQLLSNITVNFPIATLLANFLSCLLMGIGLYILKIKTGSESAWFMLIGFCGGFSTFSTFSYETLQLMQQQYYLFAFINIFISVIICIGVLYVLHKFN